jgi:transposase InsO family protein
VVAAYESEGSRLRRVLTDNGKEFQGAFRATCAAGWIRHTRTKPRHPWTDGFVERLQGTIVHEHGRVAFRRQHFTRLDEQERSLDGFLRFYNTRRPHQGYRLRGQTPVTVFAGAVEA